MTFDDHRIESKEDVEEGKVEGKRKDAKETWSKLPDSRRSEHQKGTAQTVEGKFDAAKRGKETAQNKEKTERTEDIERAKQS